MQAFFYLLSCLLTGLVVALSQQAVVSFTSDEGAVQLAGSNVSPIILVNQGDYIGVKRAAADLAADFGRVTGTTGSLITVTSSVANISDFSPVIIIGTIGQSKLIDSLIKQQKLDVSEIQGHWESFQTQLVKDPMPGVKSCLVIVGADKRGSIYGIYDISEQIGVSPWYWWADSSPQHQDNIYSLPGIKVQPSPSVKYRGIFLNDEQPALTNWIQTNYAAGKYGPGYNHVFYSTVFELLLRLRANYLWPAEWNSMFYVDDAQNQVLANQYGVVIGTSHTEPLARATKEQSLFLNGIWSWSNNQQNVTDFMKFGAMRAKPFETLYTMGMRGLGDTASPTLNAASLEVIIQTQQQILRQVFNASDVSTIPQMWCLYKEVGGYFAQGLSVPDDITLLWADDNWGNPQRLPLDNETSRIGGAGLYYHFDYVGNPRDYKWINTISLLKSWEALNQAYERSARNIWIFNVGDLKPLEIPISHALDLAYDMPLWSSSNSTEAWAKAWASREFSIAVASDVSDVLLTYSMLASRRKYELLDPTIYSLINYNEADVVLQQWMTLARNAQAIYDSLEAAQQPSFFEMVLHPCMAGYTVHQIYVNAAKNALYSEQRRTSSNSYVQEVLTAFSMDQSLQDRYHSLLGGKWNHMMDQTHLGYTYWQQPERNTLPPLSYVQSQEVSLAGLMGVTCEGNNGTVPGDDMYHSLSSNNLVLPPMDPYGPSTRWIDIFSRGNAPFDYLVSTGVAYVTASPSSGTLAGGGTANATDVRIHLCVDWDAAPAGSTSITINVTTSSGGVYPFHQQYEYGNYGMPTITLHLNKTSVPSSFHGFVETDGHISIEPEHFDSNISTSSSSAYYAIISGYGRTLSGLTLLPYTAPSQSATAPDSPRLTYNFYTFEQSASANISVYIGTAFNTNPSRPLMYAISVDDETPQIIQPIPSTPIGTLPSTWTAMVSNAATFNTTTHVIAAGAHVLNLWALEPALTFQKIVVDLGGVRQSYLGPPESMRV